MFFTEVQFNTMILEVTATVPRYDMLCFIAEKSLFALVKSWCVKANLINGETVDELMQIIQTRLITTVVTKFLYHDGFGCPCNNDYEGFNKWMHTVAKNTALTYFAKIRNEYKRMASLDETKTAEAVVDLNDCGQDNIDRLKESFDIAMSSNKSVYMILTWLAQFVFMIKSDASKIKSNDLILLNFTDCPLNDMYALLKGAAKTIPWVVITDEQDKKIKKALQKKADSEVTFGELRYKDFFMKYKGEKNGKKSISDWMYRMSEYIKKKLASSDNKK